MDSMNSVELAKTIAKSFEGWSPVVYLCPAGYPTIAWGHRCAKNFPPVNQEQGEVLLTRDMMIAIIGALKYCPSLNQYPHRLAAIIDFCFNLGVGRLQTSTLRRKINQGNFAVAERELSKWVHGGGRVLKGLVSRRMAEIAIMRKDNK